LGYEFGGNHACPELAVMTIEITLDVITDLPPGIVNEEGEGVVVGQRRGSAWLTMVARQAGRLNTSERAVNGYVYSEN
jgi:hypothetical protein